MKWPVLAPSLGESLESSNESSKAAARRANSQFLSPWYEVKADCQEHAVAPEYHRANSEATRDAAAPSDHGEGIGRTDHPRHACAAQDDRSSRPGKAHTEAHP